MARGGKIRGDRGETNPTKRNYSPAFYRPQPPASDDPKHLGLILAKHGAGFPYFASVPI